MKKIIILLLVFVFLTGCGNLISNTNQSSKNVNTLENIDISNISGAENINSDVHNESNPMVRIKTNKGEITLELFIDDAPKTVENFISLVKKGYYDGVIFHRVISGFMIQGGDPTGTGRGGPGYKFADELNPQTPSYQQGYVRGVLAMANSGPNTNGSQFFIMHQDYSLPHAYTIFGRVISGLETVDAIAETKTDSADKPLESIIMEKVEIVE